MFYRQCKKFKSIFIHFNCSFIQPKQQTSGHNITVLLKVCIYIAIYICYIIHDYFPAPDDYTFLMQDLNFNATVTHMCVNIIIASDSINEVAAEMFIVFLNSTDSAVVLGQSTTVTIGTS